jgi:hypothetical protein
MMDSETVLPRTEVSAAIVVLGAGQFADQLVRFLGPADRTWDAGDGASDRRNGWEIREPARPVAEVRLLLGALMSRARTVKSGLAELERMGDLTSLSLWLWVATDDEGAGLSLTAEDVREAVALGATIQISVLCGVRFASPVAG